MHAGAGVDVLLPVVRQVVGEAADQRVRHQAAGRDAAIDHVGFCRLLHKLLAAAAGPLAVDVAVHEELRRDDVQLLAHVLAHALHGLATVGVRAGGVGRLVAVLHALQVLGQCLATRPAGCVLGQHWDFGLLALERGQLRLEAGFVLGQRLGEQRALLRRHGLGPGAELPTLQARQLQVELVQARIAPGDLAALAFELAPLGLDLLVLGLDLQAHALQQRHHVGRQLCLVDGG